jgi:hypothetical protein
MAYTQNLRPRSVLSSCVILLAMGCSGTGADSSTHDTVLELNAPRYAAIGFNHGSNPPDAALVCSDINPPLAPKDATLNSVWINLGPFDSSLKTQMGKAGAVVINGESYANSIVLIANGKEFPSVNSYLFETKRFMVQVVANFDYGDEFY